MKSKHVKQNPPCPHCASQEVSKNGHKNTQQRFRCPSCQHTFGPTFGPPLYRLRTPAQEVAHSLLVVMRRGSLSGAQEITGHKYETIGIWLRRTAEHAEALTQVLVHDLNLSTVEVDAFWSFVKKSAPLLKTAATRRRRWASAGGVSA
jgi:transposase-like protein